MASLEDARQPGSGCARLSRKVAFSSLKRTVADQASGFGIRQSLSGKNCRRHYLRTNFPPELKLPSLVHRRRVICQGWIRPAESAQKAQAGVGSTGPASGSGQRTAITTGVTNLGA